MDIKNVLCANQNMEKGDKKNYLESYKYKAEFSFWGVFGILRFYIIIIDVVVIGISQIKMI